MKKKILFIFIIVLFMGGLFLFLGKGSVFENNRLLAAAKGFLSFGKAEEPPSSILLLEQELKEKYEALQRESTNQIDEMSEKVDLLDEKITKLETQIQTLGLIISEKEIKKAGGIEIENEETEEESENKEEEIIEEDEEKKGDICSVNSININIASKEELQKIKGVGAVFAQRIIEARPFYSVNDLIKVSGIGKKTLQKIIEQGCAYAAGFYAGGGSGGGGGGAAAPPPNPEVNLLYIRENPVNKQIKVELSVLNLKSVAYDVKISIEKNEVLSQICKIYNQEENWQCPNEEGQWQNSLYYLNNVFMGPTFAGDFRLKIKDNESDFRGEADVIVKIRDSQTRTVRAQWQGKINITEPEDREPDENGDNGDENGENGGNGNGNGDDNGEDEDEEGDEKGELPASNLLLNEFFEEWELNNTKPLYWTGSHSFNTNWFQNTDALLGNYSVRVGSSTERTLIQDNLIIEANNYTTAAYLKGGGQARVAILMGETGHVEYGSWTNIQTEQWTLITHSRIITAGNLGGIRIQTKDEANILIGAAWLSAGPPPENWLNPFP